MMVWRYFRLRSVLLCLCICSLSLMLAACGDNDVSNDANEESNHTEEVTGNDEGETSDEPSEESVSEGNNVDEEDYEEIDSSDYPDIVADDDRAGQGLTDLIEHVSKMDVEWTYQLGTREPADYHFTYEWIEEKDDGDYNIIHLTYDNSTEDIVFDGEIKVYEDGQVFAVGEDEDINPDPDEYYDVDSYIRDIFYSISLNMEVWNGPGRYRSGILYGGDMTPLVDFDTGTDTIAGLEVDTYKLKTGDESGGLTEIGDTEIEVAYFDDFEVLLHARYYKEDREVFSSKWNTLELRD